MLALTSHLKGLIIQVNKMKIIDFPYGKITKTLRKATKWLNSNRRRLERTKCQGSFDYPYYWDMPKIISHRLNGDEVDWLQSEVYDWKYKMTVSEYDDQFIDENIK